MEDTRSYLWRIWLAITLTSLGVLYYLVFLFYLCGGVPIEKIHYFMTDGWPNFCADNVPLVAPVFLFVGLYFWYSYTMRQKPKPVPEPEYDFHFNKAEKAPEVNQELDYIFESRANRAAKPSAALPRDNETVD
jgi:hypothetical protein